MVQIPAVSVPRPSVGGPRPLIASRAPARRLAALAAALGLVPALSATAAITWNGGNGDGDFASPANWGGTDPDSGDDGTLDDGDLIFAGAVQTTVTVDIDYSGIDSIVFAGDADTFTIDGDVDGNTETLTFNDGASIVNDSTVSGDQTFGGGVALVFGGSSATITNNDANGDSDLVFDSAMDISGGGSFVLTIDGTGDVVINGIVSGSGAVSWDGSGTLTLGAANTYTGGTTLSGGTVALGDAAGFGTGSIAVDGDTVLQGTGGAIAGVANDFTISGGDTLTLGGGEDLEFAGNFFGSGAIDVNMATAADAVTFTGSNGALLGGLTLTQGTIVANNSGALGPFALRVEGGDGDAILQAGSDGLTLSTGINLTGNMGNAVLDITGANDLTLLGALVGDGRLEIGMDAGTVLTLGGSSVGFSGVVSIDNAGAVLAIRNSNALGSGSLELEADGELRADEDERRFSPDIALGANTLTIGGDQDLELSGIISGTGGLTLNATGVRLTLGGASTYTGATTLTDGILDVQTDDAIGDGGGGATLVLNGGTLATSGEDVSLDANVTIGGDFSVEDLILGSLELSGTVDLGDADRTITTDTGSELTLSGVISSTGQDDAIIKGGDGILILSADNTGWNGGLTLNAGALGIGDDAALGGGALTVGGDASLFGSGTGVTLANAIGLGANTLTLGGTENLVLTGAITGTGGLVLSSSGEITLSSGASTYSGGTEVLGGTVVVTNAEAFGTGPIDFSGGTLEAGVGGITLDEAITASGRFTVGGIQDLGLSGNIDGDSGLTVDFDSSARTLTLSGTNTFTGDLRINEGSVSVAGGAAIANSVTVDFSGVGNGTLDLAASETIAGLLGGDATDGVSLNANTLTLAGDGSTDLAFGGIISGTGGVTVTGGMHRLDGANTYTGTTLVSGGTLGGDGSIDGDLSVTGGLFDVGSLDAVGTFDVDGNVSVGSGGTLVIDLGGAGLAQADLLAATGTATLASGSTLEVDLEQVANTYVVSNSTFEILTATGGITDNGVTVMTDSATLQFYLLSELDVDGGFENGDTSLSLQAFRSGNAFSNPAVVRAGNNRIVGGVLDSLVTVADAANGQGGAASLLATLQVLNAADLNTALEQLAPVAAATPAAIATSGIAAYSNIQAGYLAARRSGTEGLYMASSGLGDPARTTRSDSGLSLGMVGSADPWLLSAAATAAQDEDLTVRGARSARSSGGVGDGLVGSRIKTYDQNVWAKVYAFQSDLDAEGPRTGYDADFVGAQAGWDMRVGEQFTLGFGFGYLETEADLLPVRGDLEADSFRVGPYASWSDGDWFVDASLTYGFAQYDQNRRIAIPGQPVSIANGDFDGTDLTGYVGVGRSFSFGDDRWTITPNASIRYSTLDYDGYTETGAGVNNMIISDRDQDSLQGRVAVTVGRAFQGRRLTIRPEVTVGWEHEFEDYDPVTAAFVVGGSPFSVDVGTPVADALLVGFGFSMQLDQRFSGYVRFDGLIGGDADTQGVTAGLNLRF